ncbi:MAG: hypothetical protein HZB86_02105 [Deltaproteobacteria bacterium]|nr:hypothetical protein [Deltaproteobacteria bacterium]
MPDEAAVTAISEERKPSFVSRYFRGVLCGLFIVVYVPLMAREWFALRSEGLHDIEWHSTALAVLLERDLEQRLALTEVLSRLDDPGNLRDLESHIRQKMGYLGLQTVKIYERNGSIVYPPDSGEARKKPKKDAGFVAALDGKVVSKVISRDEHRQEYGQEIPADLAEVYIPIRDREGAVLFVMEAYYGISEILERNRRLLWQNALTLAAVLALLLAAGGYLYRSRQSLERKVEVLESILPICMHCKKIHVKRPDGPGRWVPVETFFRQEDRLEFSHGVCSDCLKTHYPGIGVSGQGGRNPGA